MSIGSSLPQEAASQLAQNGSTPVELVKTLCHRFHSVARQLRLRGEHRATLSVEDEIDVQDLLHALLRIQFDDIDTEEWTPSYAEGAPRTTFLLNDNQLAVLVKKTRNGLTAKDLTERLGSIPSAISPKADVRRSCALFTTPMAASVIRELSKPRSPR